MERFTPGRYERLGDPNDPDPHRTHIRRYSWRKARSQILVPGLAQLLITCILVSTLAATFAGYAEEETLDVRQRHIYNFMMTGLIIALTINLTSSMKSYVQVLRWRLIAATSLSIEELDLALDCASQTKTLKLFFLYSWRERKFTRVQVLCLLWIFVNLASAVVTGLLGLVQEFDPVTALVSRTGQVWVADLSTIWSADGGTVSSVVNAYGVQGGQDYTIQLANDALTAHYPGSDLACEPSDKSVTNCIYANETDDFAAYRLTILNAKVLNETGATVSNKSDFYVESTASCVAYKVLNDILTDDTVYFNYEDDAGHPQKLYVENWSHGSVTYISDPKSSCGSRCTHVLAVQVQQNPADFTDPNEILNITSSTIFDCNNTVSKVFDLNSNDDSAIFFDDGTARWVAGAIGWTGFYYQIANTSVWDTREYHLYSANSYWSPNYALNTRDLTSGNEIINNENSYQNQPGVEALIQQFSMYALAALDDNGYQTLANSSLIPVSSVQLVIEWNYAVPILISIPAFQLAFLVAVALWANNAVIRDDSMLSTARLLMPLLKHLNVEKENRRLSIGSVLSGEEIARLHPERDSRFFYGYTRHGFSEEPPAYSAEIVKETDKVRPRGIRNFPDGDYH